ncbi:MAG: hypothetical protein EON57_09820, partial [Alphaproteobacteria bacterium]
RAGGDEQLPAPQRLGREEGFDVVEDLLRLQHAAVAKLPKPPFCVGFAAESEKLAEHADTKRRRKGIPLIVANLGPATFGRDDNALLLIDEQGQRELPETGGRADKLSLARELIAELSKRL